MMEPAPERREFASGAELAPAFAAWTADWLRTAIEARGMALLVVSGGSTPKRYFQALSTRAARLGARSHYARGRTTGSRRQPALECASRA